MASAKKITIITLVKYANSPLTIPRRYTYRFPIFMYICSMASA